MNVWELMDSHQKEYSPKEKIVYELIKKEPYSFASSTAMEVADKYHISQSSISRFCKRLGYYGYTDFRMSLAANAYPGRVESESPLYSEVLSECAQRIAQSLDHKQLDTIIEKMKDADTIFCSGYGMSGVSASYLYLKLMILNLKSVNISPSCEVESLRIMRNRDVLFLMSASNPSHKNMFLMLNDLPKEEWPFIVLVCCRKNHPFAKYADEVIVLPDLNLINNSYFIDTSIPQIDFIQLFAYYLQEKNRDFE